MSNESTETDSNSNDYLKHLDYQEQPLPEVPWHLDFLGVTDAWKRGYESSPTVGVAVIDSGVDVREGFARRHLGDNKKRWPASVGKGRRGLVKGEDFVGKGGGRYRFLDRFGHGTKMAGIIGALPRATINTRTGKVETYLYDGTLGIAPNCRLVNLRVADDEGMVQTRHIVDAAGFLRQKNQKLGSAWGVDVALLALDEDLWTEDGSDERQKNLVDSLEAFTKAGVVVILSAGDHPPTGCHLKEGPWMAFSNTVMVTALRRTKHGETPALLPGANFGEAVSIAAPGEDIMTTSPVAPTPAYGTSAAAAVVAGAAALVCAQVRAAKQDPKPDQIVKTLLAATREYEGIPKVLDLRGLP